MAPLTPQEKQWLSAISWAEGTYKPGKGPQYNIMFGGGTFSDLSRHPDRVVRGTGVSSSAAGAYQFMPGTWAAVSKQVGAKDFGPEAQDRAALALIRQRGVDPAKDPITPQTVAKLAPEWASLPTVKGTSYYPNQSVKRFADIQKFLGTMNVAGGAPGGAPSQAPAPAPAAARVSLPRFDLRGALKNLLFQQSLEQVGSPVIAGTRALELQQKAEELRDEGLDDEAEIVESQITASLAAETPNQGFDPTKLVDNLLRVKQDEAAYNTQMSQIEQSLNDVATSLAAQGVGVNAATGAKPAQGVASTGGSLAYPGAVVTSAVDATGEPGLDFALKGGRGAAFASPFNAEVLKVVRETNTANRGPGGKGYGNYIELRGAGPKGPFDTLIAHFDELNPNIKPGMKIAAGTYLGKQGETGRATGPHISMDFFDVGKTTASRDILQLRDQVADKIKRGLPLFG